MRTVEPGIETDLAGQLTYSDYLSLDQLLSAQHPRSRPLHHDELLFIIQHQTSELWMKLILHELGAALAEIQADRLDPCFKILARVKQVQRQLFEQWGVLETLTPSEYAHFRGVLQKASGLQSYQYRAIEFRLGAKDAEMLAFFRHQPVVHRDLERILHEPSLYDEFLRYLARRGFDVPAHCVERDWSRPHEREPGLIPVFRQIYTEAERHWDAYEMCEKLVDVEEQFQLWRFRHMKTVERIIGYRRGTGGSSGVAFLKAALEASFFPELLDVRTEISPA